ncbi:MAG TPA: PrsW family glutamic-type intramembrane protease [Trebonia sp.]|nr:PrsW family glutamic-type intramembrane protease [Trebonia sp.]
MDIFKATPDPASGGWNTALPTRIDVAGGEVRLSLEGTDFTVRAGETAKIGRSPDNDLVTAAPTVSRHHAVLGPGPGGWEFENVGSAATFLNGQQVTQVTVDHPLDLVLGSVDGPVLHVAPVVQAAPPTAAELPGGAPAGSAPPTAVRVPGPPPFPPPAPPGMGPVPGPQVPPWAGWGGQAPPQQQPGGLSGDEMATALRILFPIQSWLHDSGWRQGLRLLVIAYALLPLVFLALLSSSSDLSTPGWAYSLYIAPLWGAGFWMLIRPGRIGKREMQIGAGIIVWTLAWMKLITVHINDALHLSGSIGFFPAIAVGFNEEITKALPVLLAGYLLLRYRSVKLDVRMSMFLGTVAGLTFGVAEQAFYTSNDIIGINQAQSANAAVNAALAFAERIFVDGFQHAVWAGIAGFFIGMAINYRRRRFGLTALGIAVPAILHALNDFLAGSSIWLVILVQAASLLLFLGYTMSAAAIEQRVRETPLFRGDSMLLPIIPDPNQPPPSRPGS